MMRWAIRSRLGSTLGFSQPLSGFLAQPEVRGFVSCRNRSWDLPSECSPRKDRAPLSGPASSRSYPPACRDALLPPFTDRFADSHTFARLPGIPDRLCPPFPPTRRPTSRTSWARAMKPPLSASFTCFEAFLPSRIRSLLTRVAPRQRPILSWVSSPLESSPTTPRSLEPAQAART